MYCSSTGPKLVDTEAMLRLGDKYDVTILRDTWGVPHVFGKTDADAAFGLGYAHCEDDFDTIQLALLAARGDLARHIGRDGTPNDYVVQLLKIREVLDAEYETQLSPEIRAVCEAFADGFNLYAAQNPDKVKPGVLPVEGKDIVAGFTHKTPFFFGLDRVLQNLFTQDEKVEVASGERTPERIFMASLMYEDKGSNTFGVAPKRTADGSTFLAINSHQPYDGPVAWYEAHIHSEEGWDMFGGVFPGTPVILHGHNRNLGWAHTVNSPDLIDVFELELHPDNPDWYRYDGAWRRLKKGTAQLPIKLAGPIRWTFKRDLFWAEQGPVMREETEDGWKAFAIRYAGYGDLRIVEQWYRMNKASNFDEWRDAMRMHALPSFNTGYADKEGNIAYIYNAKLPMRAEGYDWSEPVPGTSSETLWTEYLPWDKNPMVVNPEVGYFTNANSDPFRAVVGDGNAKREDYAESFGIEDTMTNRAYRALELFDADASITWDEFVTYKYDMRYSTQSEVPGIIEEISERAKTEKDPVALEAVPILEAWDLNTNPESTSAAIGVLTLQPAVTKMRNGEEVDAWELFAEAANNLKKHHGRVDVPWSEVNRLRRGEVDIPIGGGPDILHAVYGEYQEDSGTLTGRAGDCFVVLAKWTDGKVSSQVIHQYGSATLDETSPHYADQSPLFAERQMRDVWMDEDVIRANLEREYRPGR